MCVPLPSDPVLRGTVGAPGQEPARLTEKPTQEPVPYVLRDGAPIPRLLGRGVTPHRGGLPAVDFIRDGRDGPPRAS